MINIIINSGYSFFSLRKSLILFLLNKNYKITIYSPNNIKKIKECFSSKNLKVAQLNLNENKKSFKDLYKNFILLKNKLYNKENSINIVFGSYLNLVYGLLSIFLFSKKNILVFTGLGSFFNSKKTILIFLLKCIFNFIISQKNIFFIFYNINDRDFLIKKKFHSKTKIILGSGIKIKNNKITFKKRNKKKVNFVFYSRLNRDKGLSDLFKAIKIVNLKGYENLCKFYFYGLFDNNPTSYNKSDLNKIILNIKNSYFKETNYDINLKKIFHDKDVFILPSYREGLPKSALEAMNYGKVLLLSNIPGHRFLINKKNRNGFYFKKKNEFDLANKIIWMINNRKKFITYSHNSKKNLIKFSDITINKNFYETIKKI